MRVVQWWWWCGKKMSEGGVMVAEVF